MKRIFIGVILFLLVITPVYANEKVEVTFSKCVDGDTAKFILNGEEITARFLAVDTPETVHPTKEEEPFGKEASNYTCEKLTNASKIVLEYDDGSDKTDKYDRHLVWVFYDDNFLQEELLSLGYAKIAYIYGDYTYTDELQQVENNSRQNKIGLWSDYIEEETEEEYTVTFSYDGKTEKVEVKSGEVVSPISNPKKNNYKFLGWYLDDEIYDFSLPVTSDIKLVAKFEKISESVPIYIYVIAIIVFILVIVTNYKNSRRKLKTKVKNKLKKKLLKK